MKIGEWVYLFGVSIAAAVFAGQILRLPVVAEASGVHGSPLAAKVQLPAVSGDVPGPAEDGVPTAPDRPDTSVPDTLRGTPRDVDANRIRELIRSGRLSDREARYYRELSPVAEPAGEAGDRAENRGEDGRPRRRGKRNQDGDEPEKTPW